MLALQERSFYLLSASLCGKLLENPETLSKIGLTQLVFCDLSTPANGHGFSVYEDMRDKLVLRGVPADSLAFIHDFESDAAKSELFRALRAGSVRILFGSTQKMGSGTNVQERLVALHHLDAPWRPADVEQREGRILRQGNSNSEVQIYRYVTEQSFDAYSWQTLETKAKFIAQVMTGESDLRRIEDVDGAALTYAEVKAIASGNPLVIEKATIDAEVARLSRLQTQHHETQFKLGQRIRHLTDEVPRLEKRIEAVREDLARRQDTRGDLFVIEIDGQTIRDRGIGGELINRHAAGIRGHRGGRVIGHCAGFELCVADSFMGGPDILVRGADTYLAKVSDSAHGTMRSIEHTLQNLDEVAFRTEEQTIDTRKRIADLTAQRGQPFDHSDRLASLIKRQSEIADMLDLTKNQASSQLSAGPSAEASEAKEEEDMTLREMGFPEY